MNSYSEISHNRDYNASMLSAKVSCDNMSMLSSVYTQNQNRLFADKINVHDCEMHHGYQRDIETIKNNESDLLKGFSINKKSCIYKRPNYGTGDWSSQFQHSDLFANQLNSGKLFDFQSKAKGTNEPILCDYSKVILEEECSKGPYATYTRTFTSDYYDCVI